MCVKIWVQDLLHVGHVPTCCSSTEHVDINMLLQYRACRYQHALCVNRVEQLNMGSSLPSGHPGGMLAWRLAALRAG